MNKLIIPGTVEKEFPADELKKVKRCLNLRGFISLMFKTTGLPEKRIQQYVKNKKGPIEKVDLIIDFTNKFLEQTA